MPRIFGEVLARVCPELAGMDSVSLLNVFYGAELLNRGLLLDGLRAWGKVDPWGSGELMLAIRLVEPDILLNAVAEQIHGGFDKGGGGAGGLTDLVVGALLGPRVTLIPDYYSEAGAFLTRVVGTKYEGRCDILADMRVGDYVRLWHDEENRYDPNAVAVAAKHGYGWYDLGYVRRPIAARLSARMKKGAIMDGQIAVLLGEQADPNERVYVAVRVWEKEQVGVRESRMKRGQREKRASETGSEQSREIG